MKKISFIIVIILLLSCNGENVPDCFQNAGRIIQQEVSVPNFDKILVWERIELIIKDEPTQKVTVETGEYLINDIEVSVVDGTLILKNNNACNFTRDYGITKVYVSTPDLAEIRNSSGLDVRSDGILNFSDLNLIAEDFGATDVFHTDGDFYLEINCNSLDIVTNNISNIFVSGEVYFLNVRFFSGDGRFEGANLIAQEVLIFQRSSNDMIVNPQQSLRGQIRNTGDVIALNRPAVVEVTEFYTGRLIFQD